MALQHATFTPANAVMMNLMEGGVPVEHGTAIIKDVMANSLMMQLAKYEEMTKPEKEFDVFLGGLGAYWVGEGQRIQTTTPKWAKVKMKAYKMAIILPVSREYLHYKQSDFFEMMKPHLAEAFYKKFDAATFLNVDNPFEQSVAQAAEAQKVEGPLTIENFDALVATLNDSGIEPNAVVSKIMNTTALKAMVRDENGLKTRAYDHTSKTIDGIPVFNLHKDIEEMKKGTLYAGDFSLARFGIPYNMNYEISTDATITTVTGEGGQPLNLFEREMMALRVTMDVAFMILKDEAFGTLQAPAGP